MLTIIPDVVLCVYNFQLLTMNIRCIISKHRAYTTQHTADDTVLRNKCMGLFVCLRRFDVLIAIFPEVRVDCKPNPSNLHFGGNCLC